MTSSCWTRWAVWVGSIIMGCVVGVQALDSDRAAPRPVKRESRPAGGDVKTTFDGGVCVDGPRQGMPCDFDNDCNACDATGEDCDSDADCPDVCSDDPSTTCSSDCECECNCNGGGPSPRGPTGFSCQCPDGQPPDCPTTCDSDSCSIGTCGFECGNGIVDPGEQCDDGNGIDGDCCAADCTFEPGGTMCGNGPTVCSAQDTCDGAGMCQPNHTDQGVPCMVDTCPPTACDGGGMCSEVPCPPAQTCVGGACVPPNDACADAIAVDVPSQTSGSTLNSTFDVIQFCDTSNTGPGVWYTVIGTGNTLTASLCTGNTAYDSKLTVLCGGCPMEPTSDCCFNNGSPGCSDMACQDTVCAFDPFCCDTQWDTTCAGEAAGSCGDLCGSGVNCVVGNDDSCGLLSEVSWCSREGIVYHILVHGFQQSVGNFELDVSDDGQGCAGAVACPVPCESDPSLCPASCDPAAPCADDNGCVVAVYHAGEVCGVAGEIAQVPYFLDVIVPITGWQVATCPTSPLTINALAPGAAAQALNGGAGPDFYGLNLNPVNGPDCATVGVVNNTGGGGVFLGPGNDLEIHVADVFIPFNTPPGVYPVVYDNGLGNPVLINAVVEAGVTIPTCNVPGSVLIAQCGDGVPECDEECDDGGGNSDTTPDACRSDCNLPRCGDGVTDSNEQCDDGNMIDFDTCSNDCMTQPDRDGDGVADPFDQCPQNPARVCVGVCGCNYDGPVSADPLQPCVDIGPFCDDLGADYDIDSDGDGTYDCHDHCPFDFNKDQPGICGCQWPDVDTDGDGTYDCPCPDLPQPCMPGSDHCSAGECVECGNAGFGATCEAGQFVCIVAGVCGDYCPTDPDALHPGVCGCHTGPGDSDGDGVPDCEDGCPQDGNKTAPGLCGCGIADTGDGDGDGVLDCLDACPDDPAKSDAPGLCGCGEVETPAGGYTVGGFVHIPILDPGDALDGIPYVEVQLTCESLDPLYEATQLTTTCASVDHTGLFEFGGVPCGRCHLSFRYTDTCVDRFDVNACGESSSVGAGEWVTISVNAASGGGMAPCLQSIDVAATNDTYDILMQNAACPAQPGAPCFDHLGRPSPSLVQSLPRLAGCFFGNACCGPVGDPEPGPVTDCLCAYDCNNDGIFSVVSDLWCWSQCLVAGVCHPDDCGDEPLPPGTLPAGSNGHVAGGIVFADHERPLTSGVEGIIVELTADSGVMRRARTNRIGVWAIDGLAAGRYRVTVPGDSAVSVIEVSAANARANQSIAWHLEAATRRHGQRVQR